MLPMTRSPQKSDAPLDQQGLEALKSASNLPPILYNSPELAAWHEAGHVETALRVGATVVKVELYRGCSRSHGRTRVDRTDAQAGHIALGGFAVEVLLYLQGRLHDADGTPMTMKEFIDGAIRNAADDYAAFWKLHPELAESLDEKGRDEKFMAYARGMAEDKMNFAVVERVANALLAHNRLDEAGLTAELQADSSDTAA